MSKAYADFVCLFSGPWFPRRIDNKNFYWLDGMKGLTMIGSDFSLV